MESVLKEFENKSEICIAGVVRFIFLDTELGTDLQAIDGVVEFLRSESWMRSCYALRQLAFNLEQVVNDIKACPTSSVDLEPLLNQVLGGCTILCPVSIWKRLRESLVDFETITKVPKRSAPLYGTMKESPNKMPKLDTATSSMTAAGPTDPAVVSLCEDSMSSDDLDAEFFTAQPLTKDTGMRGLDILVKRDEKSYTWRSEKLTGDMYLDIKIYNQSPKGKYTAGLIIRLNLCYTYSSEESEAYGFVEACRLPSKDMHSEASEGSENSGSIEIIETSEESDSVKRRKLSGSIERLSVPFKKIMYTQTGILNALKMFLVVPFQATCEVPAWVNHKSLKYYSCRNIEYQSACDQFQRETQFLQFNDLCILYEAAHQPYWRSRGDNYYMSENMSNICIETLLEIQYGEMVPQFIKRLYDICEKIIPKMNSMQVIGPPNSGKTFFFDMVTSFYLNIGHVANIVRGQNFPLNDCVHRRMLMWNEPNCCQSAWEIVKLLTAGDSCPAKIKYQSDQVISRTPLILTSNNGFMQPNATYNSRCYFETWKPAPFLKDEKLKPHPLTWKYLVLKYVIKNNI